MASSFSFFFCGINFSFFFFTKKLSTKKKILKQKTFCSFFYYRVEGSKRIELLCYRNYEKLFSLCFNLFVVLSLFLPRCENSYARWRSEQAFMISLELRLPTRTIRCSCSWIPSRSWSRAWLVRAFFCCCWDIWFKKNEQKQKTRNKKSIFWYICKIGSWVSS